MKMAESSRNGWKTLWEKEKLLVSCNFSFSQGVFKRFVLQRRKIQGLFWKGLTLTKILDWSKLKALADDKINVAEMITSVSERVENIVGKRRKCWLPAFSLFLTMFSKPFFSRGVKSLDCDVKD